jgi:hypothetical protein
MIVSINQPCYLPWIGYFDRISLSDLHVVLDHVQFEKNSFVNRNRIRSQTGWIWLTVPVSTKGKFGNLPINSLEISDGGRWKQKHWGSIQANYARMRGFEFHGPAFRQRLTGGGPGSDFLTEIMPFTDYMLSSLRIETPLVRSSEIGAIGAKSDLVLNICKNVGATIYLSGPFGRDYLDLKSFERAGIEILFHDYLPPRYHPAILGEQMTMSTLDILMTQNPEEAIDLMLSGRRVRDLAGHAVPMIAGRQGHRIMEKNTQDV